MLGRQKGDPGQIALYAGGKRDRGKAGKPLNREEMEAAIRHFDNEIRGIRQGIFLETSERDYDPNSESAQKAEEALKFYLQQKEMMVTELKRLDSTDAF